MEKSGRSQIKVERTCYLEPAPKGRMQGLSLYKWGKRGSRRLRSVWMCLSVWDLPTP